MYKFCITTFLLTRITYITFTLIAFSSNLISHYDLSSQLLNLTIFKNDFELFLLKFLSYFNSYDATLFLYISKYYYTNDSIFAFFSFFPKLIHSTYLFLTIFLYPFFTNENTLYLLSGFLLSNLFCLCNVILLYNLILKLTNSVLSAKISSLLFLINPGSMFFIAIYSENLYLLLSLLFIMTIINSPGITLYAMLLIIGMNMTRSNSLFLCAYFTIPCLAIFFSKGNMNKTRMYDDKSFKENLSKCIKIARNNINFIGKYVIMLIHSYLIFLWMTKWHPKQEICRSIDKKINENMLDYKYALFEQYCHDKHNSPINSIYSFIQSEYWNVGFMSQYKIDKIDRLLLALPMNILSAYVIWRVVNYFDFKRLLILDLEGFLFKHKPSDKSQQSSTAAINMRSYAITMTERDMIYNTFLLSALINYIVLFLVVLLLAHPQINNRQMSTCPLLYLIAGEEVKEFIYNKNSNKVHWKGFLILVFFICFSFLSCIMQVGSYGFA